MTVHLVQCGEQAERIKLHEDDMTEVLNSSVNRLEGVRCFYRDFEYDQFWWWPYIVCTSCNTTVQEEAATTRVLAVDYIDS